ncbi:hypothetical protein K2173_010232 [Erythroxylum novogranatense]|uniref:Uncharacterized protein n=1 Tax=Erythroxylum novogranatense TaxID=1862640 RepID=A0AAV8UAK7_9ROSI|nr:hypothetical protein K2173_010232 [Erythroxylum novogranatense]
MEDNTWNLRLSGSSRSYQSVIKAFSHLCVDFEDIEIEEDDDLRAEYPCPFCSEDFDLVELCYHIDEEHHVEANSELQVCPVCSTRVGVSMVGHVQVQHGEMIKSLQKLKSRQNESHPTFSFLKKEMEDGHMQSLVSGTSTVDSSSKLAPDPFLSFLFTVPSSDKSKPVQSVLSSELTSEEKSSCENMPERTVHPSTISDKEYTEKAKRNEFVQELLLSTIFDLSLCLRT